MGYSCGSSMLLLWRQLLPLLLLLIISLDVRYCHGWMVIDHQRSNIIRRPLPDLFSTAMDTENQQQSSSSPTILPSSPCLPPPLGSSSSRRKRRNNHTQNNHHTKSNNNNKPRSSSSNNKNGSRHKASRMPRSVPSLSDVWHQAATASETTDDDEKTTTAAATTATTTSPPKTAAAPAPATTTTTTTATPKVTADAPGRTKKAVAPAATAATTKTAANSKRFDNSTSSVLPKTAVAADIMVTQPQSSSSSSATKKQQPARAEPWQAGYYTSRKSQTRIQQAALISTSASASVPPPLQRATAVLETFLSIHPTKCNPANLVCALTLSAKVMGRINNNNKEHDDNSSARAHFRSLLYRCTDILHSVLQHQQLSARQLCNAAWALAKHSDRDRYFLSSMKASSSSSSSSYAEETWDLRQDDIFAGSKDGDDSSHQERLEEAIDDIAAQLISLLEKDARIAKEGELCMASWAYGILRKRRRPPGWQHRPQLAGTTTSVVPPDVGPLSQQQQQIQIQIQPRPQPQPQQKQTAVSKGGDASDFVRFEQWATTTESDISESEECSTEDSEKGCVTGMLLDMIGVALCQPLKPLETTATTKTTTGPPPLRVRNCQWSELANLAWSFASHGRYCSDEALALMKAIAGEATRRLQKEKNSNEAPEERPLSRDIAQIVWSLGIIQADNFRLGDSLIEFVDAVAAYLKLDGPEHAAAREERPFMEWSCADMVQLAMSLAHARLDESTMLHFLYSEALFRLEEQNITRASTTSAGQARKRLFSFEISVLLWAQARLYLNDSSSKVYSNFAQKAIETICSALQSKPSSFKEIGIGPQEQANIAWSLTVLELYSPAALDLLGKIFVEATASCQKDGVIQIEHAHQLWQALFLLDDACPTCVAAVPDWFRDYLRDRWNLEKARPKISSARHRSLSKTLDLMGVGHKNEHDEDIDVAIVLKPDASWTHETDDDTIEAGMKVAVEFDGPNHFTRQRIPKDGSRPDPPRALGHTVLKYRLLKKQGWNVVRVPYYEFDRIPFWASMERQRYLQRRLRTHGHLRFSEVDVSEYKAHIPNRRSRFD